MQCVVLPFVDLCFIFCCSTWLCLDWSTWLCLALQVSFVIQSLTFWPSTTYRRFKFKTGLLSISDQHLLKIKNHCIHNASTWGNGKNRLLRGDSTLKNWIVWIVYLFFPYLNLARLYSVILTVRSYVRITILEH